MPENKRHRPRPHRTTRRRQGKAVRAIDLFCGAGGSSWGLRAAGVDIVAAFDQWSLAGKVYKDNFPDTRLFKGRIESRRLGALREKLGSIDLIVASPECTSHS